MINTVDHIINIDLAKKINTNQSISIKKNDTNSHEFLINIFNNSVAYDLTSTTSRIYFEKADGNKVFLDCILDGTIVNKLSVLLTTQALTYAGTVASEITIYGTLGEILTSVTFNFTVLDLIRDDAAIESTSEFTALTDALALVTDFSNVKTEVLLARGIYATLDERLDQSDSELTETIQQQNANTTAILAIDRGIGGTKADLATIQALPPDTLRYINGATGLWYWHNGTAWVSGGTFQGVGIENGYVTPEKTSFITSTTEEVDAITDIMLSTMTNGFYINPANGEISANASYEYSDYISIDDDTRLFCSYTTAGILSFSTVCFYDVDKVFISGYQPILGGEGEKETYGVYLGVFYTIPVGAKFARFDISLSRVSIITLIKIVATTNILTVTIPKLVIPTLRLTDKKMVNFGDSLFGNFRDTNTTTDISISKVIADKTGATVYNAGFGGCRMATHTAYWDAFSMHSLADSIASGVWTVQDDALVAGAGDLPSYFTDTLAMLKTIDFSTVDFITIGYGTNDYTGNVFVNETDATFTNQWDYFKGALAYSLETIATAFPNIKIVVLSPMWVWMLLEGVYDYDSDDTVKSLNTRGYILPDYVVACETIAKEYHDLFIDNYYELGINKYNYLQYFNATDGTHPKMEGRILRGNNIGANLLSKY